MSEARHGVQMEESVRKNFVVVPHVVMMKNLSSSALRLYIVYRMICGENDGVCWASLATVGRLAQMSVMTLIAARKTLEGAGLIKLTEGRDEQNQRTILVNVLDVWKENRNWSEIDKEQIGKDPVIESVIGSSKNYRTGYTKTIEPVIQKLYTNKSTLNKSNEIKENSRQADGARVNGNGSTAKGFNVAKQPTAVPSESEQAAAKAAKHLYESLAAKNKIMRPPDMNKWRYTMLAFLEEHWERRARIKEVLKWYCENIGRPYVPKAYSPEGFISKFVAIEDAMASNAYTKTKLEIEDDALIEEGRRAETAKIVKVLPPSRDFNWDGYFEENDG